MRRLDAHLRAAVFDHLEFTDVLRASTTDRAARAALLCVKEVREIKAGALSCVNVVSKLTRTRTLDVDVAEPRDLVHLAWPLTFMKALEQLSIFFVSGADMTTWEEDCEKLVRTGALRGSKNLKWFEIGMLDAKRSALPMDAFHLESAAFKKLLRQLPLDCALMTATFGCVPASCVSELLALGADPKYTVEDLSVLESACEFQRPDVIRMLLDAGACPKSDCYKTVLPRELEGDDGTRADVVELLLEFGADPRRVGKSGSTPLHDILAQNKGRRWSEILEVVEVLLDHDRSLASAVWARKESCRETPLNTLFAFHVPVENQPALQAAAFHAIASQLSRAQSVNR